MKFLLMMVKHMTMKAWKMKIRKIPSYCANPFQSRLRRRNILTQRARMDATLLDCEVDIFKLFYRRDIIFFTVRETNRRARNVRQAFL